MFKNKYVFWSGISLWLLLLVGGGLLFWHSQQNKPTVSLQTAAASSNQAAPAATSTTTQPAATQQVTPQASSTSSSITPNTQTGPQVAGDSTTQNSAASLLDPKTFSKYTTYQTANSASYIDLQTGSGAAVSAGKQVAVYYRGWLTNGQLFDQSKTDSNGQLQAFTFTEGSHQVIAGWEQALDGMKVGGVRLLIVPPAVGYGATAQGSIPANSVLVFQVQLVAVQ